MKIKEIKLSEYNKKFSKDTIKWIGNSEIPKKLKNNLKKLPEHVSLFDLLMRIRKELQETYKFKNSSRNAETFEESRFSTVKEMLDKKLHSCGSMTAIYGNALRSRNIPVKFIHGRLPKQNKKDRHSWLKVYDPKKKDWSIDIDPTENHFGLKQEAKSIKEYYNWEELKKDYKKEKF